MIEYLAIMKTNGTLFYSREFKKTEIEEEVMLGFFAATANFSKEALHSMVEDVNLGKGKRVILSSASEERLIIAAIVNAEDNRDLVKLILDNILKWYIEKFTQNIREIDPVAISNYIDDLLKKKVLGRAYKRVLKSWISQFFLGIFSIILGYVLKEIGINQIGISAEQYSFIFFLGTLLILVVFPIPMFVSGYIVADRKKGYWNLFLYLLLVIIGFSPDPVLIVVFFGNIPMILVIATVFLLMGIYYSGKKKLKPIA